MIGAKAAIEGAALINFIEGYWRALRNFRPFPVGIARESSPNDGFKNAVSITFFFQNDFMVRNEPARFDFLETFWTQAMGFFFPIVHIPVFSSGKVEIIFNQNFKGFR